jgi:hypothetical protein
MKIFSHNYVSLMQFVLASLSMWGALFYGGFKFFGGKKEDKIEVIL